MRLANYVSMADLGCHGCRNMGEVDCGGYCGEQQYDDPDRARKVKTATIGQPVEADGNTHPGNDLGPENNDWATEGMGDVIDTFNALPTMSKVGLGVAFAGLLYLSFGKNGALKKIF